MCHSGRPLHGLRGRTPPAAGEERACPPRTRLSLDGAAVGADRAMRRNTCIADRPCIGCPGHLRRAGRLPGSRCRNRRTFRHSAAVADSLRCGRAVGRSGPKPGGGSHPPLGRGIACGGREEGAGPCDNPDGIRLDRPPSHRDTVLPHHHVGFRHPPGVVPPDIPLRPGTPCYGSSPCSADRAAAGTRPASCAHSWIDSAPRGVDIPRSWGAPPVDAAGGAAADGAVHAIRPPVAHLGRKPKSWTTCSGANHPFRRCRDPGDDGRTRAAGPAAAETWQQRPPPSPHSTGCPPTTLGSSSGDHSLPPHLLLLPVAAPARRRTQP